MYVTNGAVFYLERAVLKYKFDLNGIEEENRKNEKLDLLHAITSTTSEWEEGDIKVEDGWHREKWMACGSESLQLHYHCITNFLLNGLHPILLKSYVSK